MGKAMELEEIRRGIDSVDAEIIGLLARRADLVSAAGRLKSDEDAVRDQERVEVVINRVRRKAEEAGLDPEIAERIYRTAIDCFMNAELREFREASPEMKGADKAMLLRYRTAFSVKEAIAKRRSIRRFRPDPVPEEAVRELLEAARLAPSGCNAQPWRFRVVRDRETKAKLALAAHGQQFVADAPVVLVCCADISGYLERTVSAVQDLGRAGAVDQRIVNVLCERAERMSGLPAERIQPAAALNVAIAVEHMVLRALDFGLGTCWVKLLDEKAVKEIFGWNEDLHVVCLLPLGYPAEEPPARKRLRLEEIIID